VWGGGSLAVTAGFLGQDAHTPHNPTTPPTPNPTTPSTPNPTPPIPLCHRHPQDALDELKALLSEDEWDALQQVTSPATYFT